jgi:hypothetical protein
MPAWTLADAQAALTAWLAADLALASGQSATVGRVSITRANAADVAKSIAFWRSEVERLEAGRGQGVRVMRVTPRDL